MKKQNVLRILLFVLCAVLSLGLTVGAEEDTATEWNLINYDFDEKPSGVINEGTIADGKLTVSKNSSGAAASFYTAAVSPTATQIKSEVAVRALTGWVKVCFTNKISAQGFQVQVRSDGDVLLFGRSNNGYIDKIGSYDPTTFCKISFEMDLEEDIIRVAVNDGEAKEYNATMSAYYTSNNYDVRGLSRILVVGATPEASAEVDYIRVMSTAAPETSTETEPAPSEPETTTPATAAPDNGSTGTEEEGNVTTGAQGGEEKPSNLGLIIGIVAAVVVVAVVVVVVIKKHK